MKSLSLFSFPVLLSLGTSLVPVVQASFPWDESRGSDRSYSATREDLNIGYARDAEDWRNFKMAAHFWGEYFDTAYNPDPHYYISYARALDFAEDYAMAAKIWAKYFEKVPDPMMVYFKEAAFSCMGAKDFETAAQYFDRFIEIASATKTSINIEHASAIALVFYQVGRDEDSCHFWRYYFETPGIKPHGTLVAGAIRSYIISKKPDEVKNLYARFNGTLALPAAVHHNAASIYSELGEHKNACTAWDTYFSLAEQVTADACRLAALSYISERKLESALAVYKKIPLSDLDEFDLERLSIMSELLPPRTTTKGRARRGAKPSKTKQRAGLRDSTVHAMQVSVVSSVRAQAKALLDKVTKTEDEALTTLREKMLTHYGACVALEAEIKRAPHGISAPSVPAPAAASSSGAASSSSSHTSLSSAPQSVNPVTRAHQELREIEALHRDWSRRHTLFQAARLKEANKAHFLAFAENPGPIFTLPESMNVRYLFGHDKTKQAVPAAPLASASSSSTGSSSSSVSAAPTVTWGFATRHVTKQRDSLKKMPAYIKDKIDLYISEIEADPLQQRYKSGRLKTLVGAKNTYSRRVDHEHRFVYQLEESAPGKFTATILSFLGHYKNLDFSKQS